LDDPETMARLSTRCRMLALSQNNPRRLGAHPDLQGSSSEGQVTGTWRGTLAHLVHMLSISGGKLSVPHMGTRSAKG